MIVPFDGCDSDVERFDLSCPSQIGLAYNIRLQWQQQEAC